MEQLSFPSTALIKGTAEDRSPVTRDGHRPWNLGVYSDLTQVILLCAYTFNQII